MEKKSRKTERDEYEQGKTEGAQWARTIFSKPPVHSLPFARGYVAGIRIGFDEVFSRDED